MNLLYNSAIHLYASAARMAATRSKKVAQMLAGQREALASIEKARAEIAPDGFDYWFHAASLGEFEQARPLIEALRKQLPQTKILLTFFSPSGYNVRKNYELADCVAYLPFDTPSNVTRFLDVAAPRAAVFVKYEFWGNYLQQLAARNVPTYLVSAIFRPSQPFFKPYGGTFRKMLDCYTLIFVQDEASKQLLDSIGVTNVEVAGDTRFDRVSDIMRNAKPVPPIAEWAEDSKTLVVGSSWQPDEQCYIPWLAAHPEVKAIIAPHEFDARRLAELQGALPGKSQLWSEIGRDGTINPDTRYLIIDTFGLLSTIYRYATFAIVGGGFGAGIHNINEAAVYGIPVFFGPNNKKFKEAGDMIALGAAYQYTDAASLATLLDTVNLRAAGQKAASYIQSSLGATARILPHLLP